MNIVIYGNTNNSQLLVASGLRKLGHSVKLIVNRKQILHRPESLYPKWKDAYPSWVIDCSDVTEEDIAFETPALDRILNELASGSDLAILNDTGPCLAQHIQVPYVVHLTGSDLTYWASYDMLKHRTASWDLNFKRSPEGRLYILKFSELIARQRDGILGANLVCYPQRGFISSGDSLLDEIGVQDTRRFMFFMANLTDSNAVPFLRQGCPLKILNGCRIDYRKDRHPALSEIDFKGTDILLSGFARFIKAGGNAELRMVRKGHDVDAAIALVDNLGIEQNVVWLDEMTLTEFHREIAEVDVVCDQFGSSYPAGVTLDAFAVGRPVLANLRPDQFEKRFSSPLPGCHASTEQDVAAHLHALDQNRDLLVSIGLRGREFAQAHLSSVSMAQQMLKALELAI